MSTAYAENPQKKLENILSLAGEGKSRKEIAEILGYKDVEGLYAFTRRRGYTWNANKGLYVVKGGKQEETKAVEELETLPSKIASIISMFYKNIDGREIAKTLKFSSYQEMADYMKSKNYVWDNSVKNYIKEVVKSTAPQEREQIQVIEAAQPINNIANTNSANKYADLLELLDMNKDKLVELLAVDSSDSSLPRYSLQGLTTPKTVHINKSIDSLIKDFSDERNINQREIIKIAVIDFLKKYGYSDQVKNVLHV